MTGPERKARYTALVGTLAVLLVATVLASLVLILLIGRDLRKSQDTIEGLARDAKGQAEQVASLLAIQQQRDMERQAVIDAAIEQIDTRQREALAAHDASTQDFLRRTLQLVDQEVNAPASREDTPPVVVVGPPAAAPVAPAVPRPLPPALARKLPIPPPSVAPPAPAPPAPAPPPCDPLGKSGRCRQ